MFYEAKNKVLKGLDKRRMNTLINEFHPFANNFDFIKKLLRLTYLSLCLYDIEYDI